MREERGKIGRGVLATGGEGVNCQAAPEHGWQLAALLVLSMLFYRASAIE
jgi:hypothetical protein